MKSQTLKLYMVFSWSLLLLGGLLVWGLMEPDPAVALEPTAWDVNEIFVCGDGSAQFIELRSPAGANDQEEFDEEELVATNSGGTQGHTFTFSSDISPPTGNKSLLIATAGFASKPGGVTPDFILPAGFIFTGGGSVRFGVPPGYDIVNYGVGQLPQDGVNSLNRSGATLVSGTNSPTNYAGQSGSVSCPPPPPNLLLGKSADAAGIVEAGVVLSYTITVINSGGLPATNATIRDTLPVSTTYVPNSASNGGIFSSGIISWTNLTIDPAATLTRTFRVTVSATVITGNKITNTAFITSAQGVSATGLNVVTVGEAAVRKIILPVIYKK